jgi:hypothetical protein
LASSLGISHTELIAGLLVISLPTVATEVHNAAGLLNGILEIAISRDREASAAKEIAGDRFLRGQYGTIYFFQSSSEIRECSWDRPGADCNIADRTYRPSPGNNRIHHGHSQ